MDFPPGRTDDAGGEGSGSSRMESPRRRQVPGASRRGWRALSKREVVAIALADVQRLASADLFMGSNGSQFGRLVWFLIFARSGVLLWLACPLPAARS
mmetsp:Transcript_45655/g.114235  ORF Transcript_45655/g.114235 Transcript_45655/m.114235 type:complete len:98 (+) Transcript_45655:922-1215(+)